VILANGDWQLNLGDCIEGLRALDEDSVDVVITDPPYDEHTHNAGRRGATGYDERKRAANPRVSQRAEFNRVRELGFAPISQQQMAEVANQCARVARRWTVIFCTVEMIGDPDGSGWRGHLERAGLQYIRTCVWHKIGATPQFTGDRPAQAVEAIVVAHRPGRKRWNGGGKHGYYAHPIVLNRGGENERLHTTQKPLSLMQELVADFSEPDDLVLDPFAGSGTTGVACRMLGRRFLGFELNAEYHAIATRRLCGDEAKPKTHQPSLFGGTR